MENTGEARRAGDTVVHTHVQHRTVSGTRSGSAACLPALCPGSPEDGLPWSRARVPRKAGASLQRSRPSSLCLLGCYTNCDG